jgi:hypothetical protein
LLSVKAVDRGLYVFEHIAGSHSVIGAERAGRQLANDVGVHLEQAAHVPGVGERIDGRHFGQVQRLVVRGIGETLDLDRGQGPASGLRASRGTNALGGEVDGHAAS